MRKPPRLHRIGSRYYLRVRVPDTLRQIIGRREIVRTLRTADYREAVRRLAFENAKIEILFEQARRRRAEQPNSNLSDEDQNHLVITWLHEAERRDLEEATHSAVPPGLFDEVLLNLRHSENEHLSGDEDAVPGWRCWPQPQGSWSGTA